MSSTTPALFLGRTMPSGNAAFEVANNGWNGLWSTIVSFDDGMLAKQVCQQSKQSANKFASIIRLMTPFAPAQPTTAVLEGVFAAAVTPLDASAAPDLAALPTLIDFLAGRGCHGVLLLGTTGEGPSFSVRERIEVVREGLRYRAAAWPKLQVLPGTGCANLSDTIELTRAAF